MHQKNTNECRSRLRHNVGTCLRHVSLQSAMFQRITQHAKGMSLRYGVIVLRD